jgi:methylated-DNA-[protein]-cysteine S-methyltransferase
METYQYRTLDTPVGPLHLVGDGERVGMICFRKTDMHRLGGKLEEDPTAYRRAVTELNRYFAGKQYEFTFPYMLFADGFERKILEQLRGVKFGQTVSYKELARRAGSPRAYRAAGAACARNPLPVLIPCHRVVKADGSLGGWSGLPGVKEKLLSFEQVELKKRGSK